MGFIDLAKKELDESLNVNFTENGALSYRTSTNAILDMNFSLSSFRNQSERKIQAAFAKAFYENKLLACKFLAYLRDREQGAGERRTFRICLKWLAETNPEYAKALIPLAPFYGRFDDLWPLLDTGLKDDVIAFVRNTLSEDILGMASNKPISLCAKWMCSENASSKKTKRYASILRKGLGMTTRAYRKMLSSLRSYMNIVETDMSLGNWGNIDYSKVPSRANLIYSNAFIKNDEKRRSEYLEALSSKKEDVKINAGVLFPHDIVNKYTFYGLWNQSTKAYDETLEQLWKNLNDTVNGASNVMVVADSSSSMTCKVGTGSNVTAMTVANALAIYFSERCSGEFKDKYITFSSHPKYVDLSTCNTLHDKLGKAYSYNIVSNTDIESTFDLILHTATKNSMKQEELPDMILILSDMEFDCSYSSKPDEKLFQTINRKFTNAGYRMPKICFWNLSSRTNAIPVKSYGNGFPCALVSGFSTGVVKMVLSGKLDPYDALLDTLNKDRYKSVEDSLKGLI